jgi:hypothetical protein
MSTWPLKAFSTIALALITGALYGCAALRTHKYPAFDELRVERVGEPVSVLTTNVNSLRDVRLPSGRLVQAMPIEIIRRQQSAFSWITLAGHVAMPNDGPTRSDDARQVYLLASSQTVDSAKVAASASAPFSPTIAALVAHEDSLLAASERATLEALDQRDAWHASLRVVCVPRHLSGVTTRTVDRCLFSGHGYRLEVGDQATPSTPVAVYPFRVENRNGLLGVVAGLAIISAFVTAEVVK